jgi:hypothetical protein
MNEEAQQAQSSIVCPICKRDDTIRKVSSIVTSGTTSTVTQGQGIGFVGDDLALVVATSKGESQTQLSKQNYPRQGNQSMNHKQMVWGYL